MIYLTGVVFLTLFSALMALSANIFIAQNLPAEKVANSGFDQFFLGLLPYANYINLSFILSLIIGVSLIVSALRIDNNKKNLV